MQADLFEEPPRVTSLGPGAQLLGGFAREHARAFVDAIAGVAERAPFRHMTTPGGFVMSVAMTNCGALGWVTDRSGYRYEPADAGRPWPAMPAIFVELACRAARTAGYPDFVPDACLVNRYEPGARMALHQDRNERDFTAPIVSVSLGLPATFLWGGEARTSRVTRYRLSSGDVVVWGGPSRLTFHGVGPLADGVHELTGRVRFNLTFRAAATCGASPATHPLRARRPT